ncbi:MAG: PQQ-binding-like beta-propeller repeat protein [Planctomycetes bacterium]|nr:PQQ-binding-like beta-propeller repeat protein [Planctomycetota bacterium]MBI3835588.1 PQQ-binding-like beta-propeller repeat protein [Planctomycetota bacterium]
MLGAKQLHHDHVVRRLLSGVISLFILILDLPVFAQGQPPAAQKDDQPAGLDATKLSPNPQGETGDTYINDSFEAADALAKAKSLAARARWAEAAAIAQQTIEGQNDRLVRIDKGAYAGVRDQTNDWIATWPAAGIAAYRELTESAFASALKSLVNSHDVSELLPLFERYFCTAGAAKLADSIGRLAIESGDFDLARHVYQRVLDKHPDRDAHRTRYRAMLILIQAVTGEPVSPTDNESATRLPWKGKEQSLRAILDDVQSQFSTIASTYARAMEWPIFGGDASRNRECELRVDEAALLWRFRWQETPEENNTGAGISSESTNHSGRIRSRETSDFPVVADGFVFSQHFREIVALHLNTGALAWRFQPDAKSPETSGFLDDGPPAWDSVTVRDGRVFAALPVIDAPYYNTDSIRGISELICLDEQTGRVIWRTSSGEPDERLAEIVFDSSPLVHNGRVYVIGRRKRAFGFEDCYLLRFRASDGTLEFRTHVGSASTSGLGVQLITKAVAALHGDSIFVCSALGTVACVSADTGSVRWLRVYERARGDGAALGRSGRDATPWQVNPIIFSAGRVYCLPNDANELLVYSGSDGRELVRISMDRLNSAEMILGVRGNLLWGVGREAFCFDLEKQELRWSAKLPAASTLSGRALLTTTSVLIPYLSGFVRLDSTTGERSESKWDDEGEPGNLVASDGRLLVAGPRELSAYVRKSELWESLRAKLAAGPGDPLPAIELAEVAIGAGETKEATTALAEAVRRTTGAMANPAIRDRIFADALKFADTLSKKDLLTAELLELLYRHASDLAADPPANLSYRIAFASLFEKMNQPERAVRLYQQILRDRTLRELTRSSGAAQLTGGSIAQSNIARLIQQHGRSIYAEFDREARLWLERDMATGDIASLNRLLQTFPESEFAGPAVMRIAEIHLKNGHADAAARQYVRAYHLAGSRQNRPELMRHIGDAWAKAGRTEQAYLWLTKGGLDFPNYKFEYQGRATTLVEYRDRMGLAKNMSSSRPSTKLPIIQRFTINAEGAALLTPEFENLPASDVSRFFVVSGDGLMAYDGRTGNSLWNAKVPAKGNTTLLVSRTDSAVFASLDDVFALDARTGERRWTVSGQTQQIKENAGDWEQAGSFRTHAIAGSRLFSANDDGRIFNIDLETGRVQWVQRHRPAPLGRIRIVEPWLVYHVVQDARAALCILDAETGEWIDGIATDEKRPIEELFVTLGGQILVVTTQSIASYDIENRAKRWQAAVTGAIRRSSLLLDLDGLYLSDTGSDLRKIALSDGRMLWQTEKLSQRSDEDITVMREGLSLLVSTTTSISAVDSSTGLTLWRGTVPEKVHFIKQGLSDTHVMEFNAPLEDRDASAIYFYEHRNDTGLIPRDGVVNMGMINDLRALIALDGGVVIQVGTTIRGYTGT